MMNYIFKVLAEDPQAHSLTDMIEDPADSSSERRRLFIFYLCGSFKTGVIEEGSYANISMVQLKENYSGQKGKSLSLKNMRV